MMKKTSTSNKHFPKPITKLQDMPMPTLKKKTVEPPPPIKPLEGFRKLAAVDLVSLSSEEDDLMMDQYGKMLGEGSTRKRSNTELENKRRLSVDEKDLELKAEILESKQLPTKMKLDCQLQIVSERVNFIQFQSVYCTR